MRRAILAVLVGTFLLIGCGSSVGSGDDFGGDTVVKPDTVGDIEVTPDIPLIEVTDLGGEGIDVPPIDGTPDQGDDRVACGGLAGCQCTDNGDCKSGLCIEDVNGQFCADTCVESCADEGFRCMLVLVGGEPAYYCIPRYVNLCKPCRTNADCKANVGTDADLCVDQGPDGSFCGADCSAQSCPDGFFCQTVSIPDGGTAKQCVPSGSECECTDKYIMFNASTACFRQNANGTCTGGRYCAETGLTDCDAKDPAKETCNALDDDCDGKTDEDIAGVACEIVNVWGTCPGVMTCAAGLESCVGREPAKETCVVVDGKQVDENCDGKTDEGFPDSNGDGVPDCVGDDDDGDGIPDGLDNCPKVPNTDQKNWDKDNLGAQGDNLGDACDPDDDNDGVNDTDDCQPKNNEVYPGAPEKCDGKDNNCNGLVDENFSNIDGDALADCVDPDIDNDSILNELDNCASVYNPAQVNTDKPADNLGDACDPDDDEDGVLDEVDNCPLKKNLDQLDNDTDGQGDVCDPDDDNDDVLDVDDNCPKAANTDQNNFDGDALGDACDPDIDNDGELNETDCDDFNAAVNHFKDEVCNGIDDNCKDGIDEENAKQCFVFYRDTDLDGYGTDENKCLCQPIGDFTATQKGDCNDTATGGAINPGAKERCGNGVDDNCNGSQNDENAISCQYFFLDEDNDGYGVNLSKCFCSADGSYSAKQSGDCNDQSKLENPGLQEICDNGIDDNCNGSQNDENALNAIQFYKDADFDHYGVTTNFKRLCSAEGLYAALQGGDCDDTNPFVNPGAVERCDGKVDEDCDNLIDEEGADLCETYYFDNDHDNFGVTNSPKCLCAPIGGYTTKVSGDCNDYDATVYPTAPEICNAADDNCNNVKDDAGIKQLCGDYDDSHSLGKCTAAGTCTLDCSNGWVDVDSVFYNGCECQEDSYENSGGDSCAGAVDMGELSDSGSGSEVFVVGNILTVGDTDFYRVRAVDSPDIGDNACDNFAFNAELTENPGMAFRVTIFMGNDTAVNCSGAGQACLADTRFEWYTDFSMPDPDPKKVYKGECPCSSSVVALPNPTLVNDNGVLVDLYDPDRPDGHGKEPDGTINSGTSGANACQNNTRYFVVGVQRDPNVAITCANYKLWISNGKINH